MKLSLLLQGNSSNRVAGRIRWVAVFRLLLVGLFLMQSLAGTGQLSPDAKVSLVTIGPGSDLYSGFGHSLLWVSDPATGLDRAYNYGTFSYGEGNFYLKFLRGTLPYSLSVHSLNAALPYWKEENRYVKEQVLNLSHEQKQRVFDILEENYLPANREYRYRFFTDNCATRLQDVVIKACGDSLTYTGYTADTLSFREWIDQYAHIQKPWADFGMDLAIGSPADEIATPMHATFLPENLSLAFAGARLKTGTKEVALTGQPVVILENRPETHDSLFTPMICFYVLAILVGIFTWFQLKNKWTNLWLDRTLFFVLGIAGIFLLLLWFGTDHGVTSYNWDVLWANPLLLWLAFLIQPKQTPKWVQFFLIAYALVLLVSTSLLDKHNSVLIPILITIIIRIYFLNNLLFKSDKRAKS